MSVNVDKLFELAQVAINGHELSFKVNGQVVICDLAQISETLHHATSNGQSSSRKSGSRFC